MMEVAMTRTAIRHTLFALAALALISAFESSPASAQGVVFDEETVHLTYSGGEGPAGKNAKGFATKKGPPGPRRQFILTNELQNMNSKAR
jgi:hypothetical protein